MGEASLGMLADHVNVLEVTLDRVAFKDRRNAASIINRIDDLYCQSNRVSRSQAQDRAPIRADRSGGYRLAPNVAHRLGQKGARGSSLRTQIAHSAAAKAGCCAMNW